MSTGEPVGVLSQVGIDVADLDRSAEFWVGLLGLKVAGTAGNYLDFEKQAGVPVIYLQQVPERKTAKTRVHLDITVKDLDAAVAKAEGLGATKVRAYSEGTEQFVLMQDPDENEFCLVVG